MRWPRRDASPLERRRERSGSACGYQGRSGPKRGASENRYEIDDAAMAEAAHEQYLAHLEDEAIAQEAADADAAHEALAYYQYEMDDDKRG